MNKRSKARWWQVSIHFKPEHVDRIDKGILIAIALEERLNCDSLYFARYTEDTSVKVKLRTRADKSKIRNVAARLPEVKPYVQRVFVTPLDSASLAHGYAYQAVKAILQFHAETGQDQSMDVVHWLNNMLGRNYVHEMGAYAGTILRYCSFLSGSRDPMSPPTLARSTPYEVQAKDPGSAPAQKDANGAVRRHKH